MLPPACGAWDEGNGRGGSLCGVGAGGAGRAGGSAARLGAGGGGGWGEGGAAGGRAGGVTMTVGIMSGVMAGAGAEAMGFPHDLQNLVPAFAAAPQLTQMTVSSATGGGDGGALPNGAAHRAQNFAPGTTAAPQEGQTLVDGAASLAATGLPQLRQKRPEPAAEPHFGQFIESSNTK